MGIIGPAGIAKGSGEGFYAKPNSTTTVFMAAGSFEANGKRYNLAADDAYSLVSLLSAFDTHYIYIDDSLSSAPVPTFIDGTTPPIWNAAKNGFYNGDDRCVDAIISDTGAATITTFSVIQTSSRLIRRLMSGFNNATLQIASAMIPTGAWQTPDDSESSAVIPVNTVELYVVMQNSDVGSFVALYAASKEYADTETVVSNSPFFFSAEGAGTMLDWVPLGTSRNLRIAGGAGDDNFLNCYINGMGVRR